MPSVTGAAALLVLPGAQAQQPAESGDAEKLVLPALELRDPALRSVLGDEVAWGEELRLRAWLAVGGRAERVVREPMLIHAFNRLLPEQGGLLKGHVLWYPVPLRRPAMTIPEIPEQALCVALPDDCSPFDPLPAEDRATHLVGLASTGHLPGEVLSRGAWRVIAGEIAGEDMIDVRVRADDQEVLAEWTGERVGERAFSVIAGKVESAPVFVSPLREQVAWRVPQTMDAEQAAQMAAQKALKVSVGSAAFTREDLAWLRACDDRLQQVLRQRSDVTFVGSPAVSDRSKAEQAGTGLVAGVVICALDSQGTRRGIVVPSLWQCCLGRPPKQDQCLLIRWPDEVEGEAAAFPAVLRLELAEPAVEGAGREARVSDLQVLR